ncbi:MAG: FHA domain-containing protein [Verrucomicrobiota bacterium]
MFEFRLPGSLAHAWTGNVLTVGRDPSNGWVLATPGVWAHHAKVHRGSDGRWTLHALGDAVVAVNGIPVRESILRWGDAVSFGSTVVRFHLAAPVQRGLRGWERALWILLGLCALAQVALVLRLGN